MRLGAVVALVSVALGCAGSRPAPPEHAMARVRVLVLPPENLTGRPVQPRDLLAPIERALAMNGVEVVSGEPLDAFLARRRIRYTGGLDRASAAAAREELGADGVLVTSLETLDRGTPRLALVMRLVATTSDASILWMDGYAKAWNESPGLLGLGLVGSYDELQAEAVARLARSLAAFLEGEGGPGSACPGGALFKPKIAFRSTVLPEGRSVLVLPFVNQSRRRGAGEVVAGEFVRQLVAAGSFRVVEPGVVRDQLLRYRVVMEDGVSVDQARLMMNSLETDLVVAGYVFAFEDGEGTPAANFTALVIERATGKIVWESTSYNQGTDSESFFGLGRVAMATTLSCRMVRNVLDEFQGKSALPPKP